MRTKAVDSKYSEQVLSMVNIQYTYSKIEHLAMGTKYDSNRYVLQLRIAPGMEARTKLR